MPKIYTKTGDRGETGLWGGARVPKDHPQVAAYGDVDELNAALGMSRTWLGEGPGMADVRRELGRLQAELFDLGAELAADASHPKKAEPRIAAAHIRALERSIDVLEDGLSPLRNFILPGGSASGAALHLARTICRRAERSVVLLGRSRAVRPDILRYLNRLSDYLFVLARHVNHAQGAAETSWNPRR